MRKRAEAQERTRLRITESAVALHGTVGPARTTMSALAEHAGVTRSTLYRHFPDEASVFEACSAHWAAANPFPDPSAWAGEADPDARLRIALAELYAAYARGAQMLTNVLRDEAGVPMITAHLAAFRGYLAASADVLLGGRDDRGRARERRRAAIAHALAFPTWRSLVEEQGLREDEAVDLMAAMVAAA